VRTLETLDDAIDRVAAAMTTVHDVSERTLVVAERTPAAVDRRRWPPAAAVGIAVVVLGALTWPRGGIDAPRVASVVTTPEPLTARPLAVLNMTDAWVPTSPATLTVRVSTRGQGTLRRSGTPTRAAFELPALPGPPVLQVERLGGPERLVIDDAAPEPLILTQLEIPGLDMDRKE
jgi:hypothetical protein